MKYVYELDRIAELSIDTVTVTMQIDGDSAGRIRLHIDTDIYSSGSLDAQYISLDNLYKYLHNNTLYCYLLRLYVQYNDSIVDNDDSITTIKMLTYKCDYSYS